MGEFYVYLEYIINWLKVLIFIILYINFFILLFECFLFNMENELVNVYNFV